MKASSTGELFPDAAAIQAALERRTRDALIRRHGEPIRPNEPTAADDLGRRRAKGIGFSIDLVRSLFEGRKTQTRRLIRPLPASTPRAEDCPLGRAGDWLYVREPYRPVPDAAGGVRYAYAADATPGDAASGKVGRFRPAMAMPRDAARLWLRIGFVRVERVAAITPADLAAEGLPPGQTLAGVWDSFYTGPGERWADNPWVWVLGFRVERGTA